MKKNDIIDYTPELQANFGKAGSHQWQESIEQAENAYAGQIIRDTRREAHLTQDELAKRLNTTKSYISRIENGLITPSVTVFYRIIEALGMRVEIVKPVG